MSWKSIICGLLLAHAAALAQPTWQGDLTAPNLGPHPAIPPCALEFQVSWKGLINSGSLKMEFAPPDARKPRDYVVRASGRSLGAAAGFFPYQCDFWSELAPTTLRPRYFHATERDQKECVTTTVRYRPNRVEIREISILTATKKTSRIDQIFKFAPVFDIFSAMLHVRSQTLHVGEKITLVICPFKTPHLLRITVLAHEVHNGRPAIRLNVGLQKIKITTLELKPYKKLKKDATLWLSNDLDRIPIEFRAAVFIGDVRATLSQHHKF